MPIITELYTYAVDDGDGDEGIPAVLLEGSWWPLLGANMERVKTMREHVAFVAQLSAKKMTFKKFVLVDE
jgi:hypothetical protein